MDALEAVRCLIWRVRCLCCGEGLRQGAGELGSAKTGGRSGWLCAMNASRECSGRAPGRNQSLMPSGGAACERSTARFDSCKIRCKVSILRDVL